MKATVLCDNGSDLEPPEYLESMHREVDWMVPSDNYILQYFERAGKQTPNTVGMNIAYSYDTASKRCPVLADHGLLDRVPGKRGAYELSEFGQQYLDGDLSPEDLRNGPNE